MRPRGSPQSLEDRRRRVVAYLKKKLSLREIARRIGCHASSVLRWRNAWRSGGAEALRAKPAPGRPARLTATQQARLVTFLSQGAMAHGYRTEGWTTRRIAALIERRLRVRYHPNHVGKVLHQLGWSHQKPGGRAHERDQATIATWKQTASPRAHATPPGRTSMSPKRPARHHDNS
jgi:putative transposase